MSDVPRFSEALEGFGELATALVKQWTPFLTSVSAKVGAGPYTSNDAAVDFPAFAKLVTDSVIAIGSEGLDAVSILTGDFSEQFTIGALSTGSFSVDSVRTLAPKAAFKSVSGAELPTSHIIVDPATLAPHVTDFSLQVTVTGVKARTYDGSIVATDEKGDTKEFPMTVMVG
jgi:hypothetical protein